MTKELYMEMLKVTDLVDATNTFMVQHTYKSQYTYVRKLKSVHVCILCFLPKKLRYNLEMKNFYIPLCTYITVRRFDSPT